MTPHLDSLAALAPEARWQRARAWILSGDRAFFAALRRDAPLMRLPQVTVASRFSDCEEILRRHDLFGVSLYAPKQGDYFMAQDDTAQHWREKSMMKCVLDFEDLPGIREFCAATSRRLLAAAGGACDAVEALTRAVPLALVQERFGFDQADPRQLFESSYWSQMDAFWNQSFDANPDAERIVANREAGNVALGRYVAGLVQRRGADLAAGVTRDDPVTRLILLAKSGGLRHLTPERLVRNVGGLLIGAVETTSHAVCNAVEYFLANPGPLAAARDAARSADPSRLDGHVFEALRFRPAFPYFFRTVMAPTVLGRGEPHELALEPGETVIALSHAAMFDERAVSAPEAFDPTRGLTGNFVFGLGMHECLGRAIGAVMIPEIVRQALLLDGLETDPIDTRGGPVPESWTWRWRAAG